MNSAFSLNNAGETLSLRCCGKDATDRDGVSYTPDIGAAGDGNSLHRNGTSWTVGAPTPGSGAVLAPIVKAPEEAVAERSTDSAPAKQGGAITLTVGGNRIVLARSSTELHAKVTDAKKAVVETASIVWNLGDARTVTGASVMHAWQYPGTYRVNVRATHHGESDDASFVVEVVAPEFDVTRFEDGSIGIRNRATRDVDVSRWRIHDDGKNFVLPEGTVIMKGVLLRISPDTLGFMTTRVSLHYPDGAHYAAAALHSEEVGEIIAHVNVPTFMPPPEPVDRVRAEPVRDTGETDDAPPSSIPAAVAEAPGPEPTSSQVAAAGTLDAGWPWWLGALALSFVGAIGMYAAQRHDDPLKGWKIEDADGVE